MEFIEIKCRNCGAYIKAHGRLDDIRVIPLHNAPLARRAQDFAQQTSQKLGKPAQVSPTTPAPLTA